MAGRTRRDTRRPASPPDTNAATPGEAELLQQLVARLPPVPGATPPGQPVFFDAPEVFAAAVQTSITVNDVNVIFLRPRMGTILVDGQPTMSYTNTPSVCVNMSIGTAKDLVLSLQGLIAFYEKTFGKVETAYSRLAETTNPN